ncbi:uncharacterized protein ALTATR162_LOCUS2368 [Alternaria atra]|uniref:Uncharacterized protein n=1 Tax=Alternaria atra TaxID=119953 RepID=A0A8J2HWZ9_9PLEO|nr:uncharacterized protein ALTATR162_LOCUS2368 [Alternaria atra]CAG5149433.1 unnamed protein product [Alternaria atra]
MCRIEERMEYGLDGRPVTSSRTRLCEKARDRRPCRDVVVVPHRYNPKRTSNIRDDTPSPTNPPTPTSSGTYLVQKRRPSGSGSRPSTRDGQRPISTEIVIQLGSKKDKVKKYPSISVSTKPYDRSSLGSRASNEAAIESIGSEASYTLRTGFPEAPLPPPAFDSYLTTPTTSYGYHPSHAPSASSSQTPSLYAEDEPPTKQRSTRYPATVIHNPPPVAPSSPSQRPTGTSSGSYRTSRVAPRDLYTSDYQNPLDNDIFADHSSYTGSGGPEVNRRTKSGDERQKQSKSGRRQEDSERQAAEENERHVRFELGRADSRKKQRGERLLAEKEKDRAAVREESRRLKEQERLQQERLRQEQKDLEEKAAEEKAAKDRKKERSKPPATRPSASRRLSSSTWTPAQLADQQRLIEAEQAQMRSERLVAEAREREEEQATLKSQQQQEKPGYWDPRGGDRSLSTRRESMTRHDSVTSTPRPSGLTRTTSKRRTSISQPNPSALGSQVPTETYRPSSSRKRAPPPLSFPANFNQEHARPPSARRPSFGGQENPFAASASVMSPSAVSQDPWDLRNVESALPATRPLNDGRYDMTQPHSYVDPFATDSDSPGDYIQPAYASRTGLSRKGSKRRP